MNETLSMKQAKNIVDEVASAILSMHGKIESKSREFEAKIAQIWEDQYAVDFMNEYWKTIGEIKNNDGKRFTECAEIVKEIAEGYKKVGGMQEIVRIDTHLPVYYATPLPNPFGQVKDHFMLSPDEFGFKNLETGPDECIAYLQETEDSIFKAMDEMTSRLDAIHAFGNQNVQNAINSMYCTIFFEAQRFWMGLKLHSSSAINNAADSYRKTGENAEDTSLVNEK